MREKADQVVQGALVKMLRCPALWTSFPYLSNGDRNALFTDAVRFKCSPCGGWCSGWHVLGAQKHSYLPLHLPSEDILRSLSTHTWFLIKYQITTISLAQKTCPVSVCSNSPLSLQCVFLAVPFSAPRLAPLERCPFGTKYHSLPLPFMTESLLSLEECWSVTCHFVFQYFNKKQLYQLNIMDASRQVKITKLPTFSWSLVPAALRR